MNENAPHNETKPFDYFLVLLMICVSGNMAFIWGTRREPVLIVVALFFAAVLAYRRIPIFTKSTVLPFLVFSFILGMQSVMLSFFPVVTIFGFLVPLFIGYATARSVKGFSRVYVDVMFFVAMLSLCCYIPDQLLYASGVDVKPIFQPVHKLLGMGGTRTHILIHNFMSFNARTRNAGFFWEPGALAGYTVLAIILLGLDNKYLSSLGYKVRLLVLAACILTTLSTAGYVALPIALLLHLKVEGTTTRAFTRTVFLSTIFICTLALFTYRVQSLEFMKAKIEKQFIAARDRTEGWEVSRFGTIFFDLEYIRRRPILGWGLHSKTRFSLHEYKKAYLAQGNGFTEFTAKFGLLGMGLFVFLVWRGIYPISGYNGIRSSYSVFIILLILNTQSYLNHPLFLSLMFLSCHTYRKYPKFYPSTRPFLGQYG